MKLPFLIPPLPDRPANALALPVLAAAAPSRALGERRIPFLLPAAADPALVSSMAVRVRTMLARAGIPLPPTPPRRSRPQIQFRRPIKLTYSPVNGDVYACAYSGAYGGFTGGRAIPGVNYSAQAIAAGVWAQEFDTLWASAVQLDEVQAEMILTQSYAVWDTRAPQSLTPSEIIATIDAIIAAIDAAEAYLASQGITPPTWNTGGGGGGGGVPPVPANSVGWLLTSTNNTGSSEPASTGSAWEPSGGLGIASFTKNHGTTFEVGASDVSPTFAATYNGAPTAAEIAYTGASGSPLVLTTPFTSGQILETFTETVNGATATFELEATFSSGVKTATITDTWGLPFFSYVDLPGNIALTQAYLNTMRAADGVQIHTSPSGNYLVGADVGAGQISILGLPSSIDVGTIFTDLNNNLPVSPSLVGVISYTNPFGQTFNVNLYTIGAIAIGVTAGWGLS
jgi:hypothetical protein